MRAGYDQGERGLARASQGDGALTGEEIIPQPDFLLRHECIVHASPQDTWDALLGLRLGQLRLGRALLAVRRAPSRKGRRLSRSQSNRLFLDVIPVRMVPTEPGRQLLGAGVGRPWRSRGNRMPGLDLVQTQRFNEPGWVKLAVGFSVDEHDASAVIVTETRVFATDRPAARRLALYWALIRLAAALLRRDVLRSVAQHAEAPGSLGS